MDRAPKDDGPRSAVVPESLQVNEVRKQWVVRADSSVAEKIQDDQFKFKYTQNRQRRRTVRGDVREAKRIGSEEERLADAERRQQKILENAIRTQMLLQEETLKPGNVHCTDGNEETVARTTQQREVRRSFEGNTSQRDLAEQCQHQLQKRHSSRSSENAETDETEPGDETRAAEEASSIHRTHVTEDDEEKRKALEKEDRKLARALQKEEQRRSFEMMRRQREQMQIQHQREMYRPQDEETAPGEES